nr:glycoprotein-N-acetylgalactosamine 3-beta-galactosyltransferase [Tanacetum cinerariifolium]
MCEMFCQFIQKKQEEKQIKEEQAAKSQNSKIPVCYDDDDDYNFAITPSEPIDSLCMGDEHLDTILATESNEFLKSSVENLVPNPSESEGESECDMPACEAITTFSNVLFNADYDFYYKTDPHPFNVESDLVEPMLNHDSSIIISSKIDSLFDEFAGELTLLKSIPPGIDKTDCYHEDENRFTKRLLYYNSSPRPPEEFVSEISDAEIESFSPSPIPVKDSDSFMEEIDLSFNPDDLMPPSIKDDDHDFERDILILKELLYNYSLSLFENESYHFYILSLSRPPAKPPDGNTGTLNIKTMGDISKQKVPMPRLMITLVPNQEKSPDLLSHQGLAIYQPSAECLMIINGKNTPLLDDPQVVSEPQVLKLWFRRNSLEELFFKEEMEQENIQTSATAKFPILKQGSSTPHIQGLVTTDEKIQKKNDVKARSMLLMALPNEHLMTFNQYKDAKSLFDAITTRFGGLKRNAGPSSSSGSQNMAFVSTPSTIDNDDVSTVFGVSTTSPQVSSANLSDATVYAFLANQPNGSQLVHKDLEQIHKDDLKEMYLKWQLAMLSMRDKRVLRNQEKITRNQETTRRTVNVEDTSSKAMMAIDGAGFDWSYMANDEAPTNMAFMAFLDSERISFSRRTLVHYKKNKSLLNENIAVLRRDILIKDSEIAVLKSKLEKISKETDDTEIKITKFENASQSLDKLIGSQITDKRDDEVEFPPEIEKKTVEPSMDKVEVDIPKLNDKPARIPVKYVEMYRTQRPRGNQRNWNNLKSHQLGEAQQIWLSLILDKQMIMYELSNGLTLDNEEIELNATVYGQDKTITEASVRRHLKLADSDGISTLPITEIFEQLALMGYVIDSDKLTLQKDEAITKEMHDKLRRATTTASSLEAEQGIGNISKTQTKATPSGPSSPRTSSEGGPGCHVTIEGSPVQARPERLSNLLNEPPLEEDKVTTLDNELKSKKAVYNKALITLTKRVKKLEEKLKHKRRRAVVDSSGDEEESLDKKDSPKQGKMIDEINEDENINLVKSSKQGEAHEIARHKMKSDDIEVVDFSTASPQKNNDEITLVETLVNIKKSAIKDKGRHTLKQMKQYSFEEIKMLFDRTKESIRKFVLMESEGQIADYEAGEGSSKEGESLKRPAKKELGQEQQKKQKVKEDLSQERLQQMMVIIPEQGIHVEALQNNSSNLTKDKEIALWVELKRLFEPDEDDELWKFKSFELIWRLYDWCGVHHISTRDGHDIFMLVEKEFSLSRGSLLMMLVQKLQVDEHNEMEEELLRKIFMLAERPKNTSSLIYLNTIFILPLAMTASIMKVPTPIISCKTLAVLASILLVFIVLLFSNQPNYFQTDIFQLATTRKSSSLPQESTTNISHLVFGLLGSTKAWHYRKPYIESWWRPNVTRGFLYVDTHPTNDLLPWSPASPPFRISDDISKLLNETKHVAPIMVRMVHGVIEVFREEREGVRWYIMGDDDSMFFVDNLVDVLSTYDHTKYIYIGGHSECYMSNQIYSHDMGFGGAGLIMSYPLAKMVQKNIEDCFRRYPYLNSADLILMTCVNDFGVSMTAHQGLHQIDLRGDISGLFSSHPKAPLLSLHHIDHIDPFFRTMDRSESAKHLMKAANNGKTECCDVVVTDGMDVAKLKLRDCTEDELIA